jgi:chaperonin GroEL
MAKDNLFKGEEARNGLMNGIRKATEAVAGTLGTSGKNSLIQSFASPFHYPSNDGISILGAIRFADPLEEMGRNILGEAVSRANRANGDGSSTTCVLTSAILEEGIKHLDEASAMEIQKSLNDCIPLIEESLKSQRKEVVDKEGVIDFKLLEQVATVSSEDPSVGKMIAEIYSKIGKDGIINWESSKTSQDSYTIGTGIKIDGATYASRYMCDADGNNYTYQATIENPLVLLAKSKITAQSEMEKLVGELIEKGIKDLVIFCDEMDAPILNSFILARAPQTLGIRFLVIKMPTVFNDLWWEDLEKASGGRVISSASGIKMKDAHMGFLGQFGKITVNRDDTFIDGIKDLSNHLMGLKVDGSDDALARVARLNTKTARYYVGANSESTLRQKRDKVEDAINSAWCAMQNGILPGGGVALSEACGALMGKHAPPDTVGKEILFEALQQPMIQIVKNAGADEEDLLENLGSGEEGIGFNSKTGEYVNMFSAGIVDSFDVVMGAVKNAIGVASGILTCGSVVLLPRNENSVDEAIRNIVQTPQ